MVTFAEVGTFLKSHGSPQIVGQVEAFLRHLRAGKCYLHPFDNEGDHEYYFTNPEHKIDQLFMVAYRQRQDGVDMNIGFVCFDGEQLDLCDIFALLGHYLPYEQRFLIEHELDFSDIAIDFETKLADGKWMWAAFLVCEDHEGETAMAAYSSCLTPAEGLKILHTNMHYRLLDSARSNK